MIAAPNPLEFYMGSRRYETGKNKEFICGAHCRKGSVLRFASCRNVEKQRINYKYR